jgi:serine/threonine protein kinase
MAVDHTQIDAEAHYDMALLHRRLMGMALSPGHEQAHGTEEAPAAHEYGPQPQQQSKHEEESPPPQEAVHQSGGPLRAPLAAHACQRADATLAAAIAAVPRLPIHHGAMAAATVHQSAVPATGGRACMGSARSATGRLHTSATAASAGRLARGQMARAATNSSSSAASRQPLSSARPHSSASANHAAGGRRPAVLSARTASSATGRKIGVDPLLQHGYVTISPIANGAFSQVLRAKHLGTQQEVAVKTFSREMLSKEGNAHLLTAMRNELAVLTALRNGKHPSVANLVAVHEGPVQLVCCLEYCGGGSLHKALQRAGACDRPHAFGLGEHVSVRVARQLASALAFMHGAGFAHRDVKPQNVLFTEAPPNITPAAASRAPNAVRDHACAVKLCDFGFAVRTGGKPVRTICGTPQYMAPELATAAMTSRKGYGAYEVDLWAFGAMVFELLEGRPAFSGVGLVQLNERIRKASTNEFTSKTPPAAKALVKSLLKVEPSERKAAKDTLGHGWFAQLVAEAAAPAAATA